MTISSRTPEGSPHRCGVCGHSLRIEPSVPPGDAPCPHCGSLLWFAETVSGDKSGPWPLDAMLPDLRTTDRDKAIRQIIEQLSLVGAVRQEHVGGIVDAVLQRERLGSTGIGRGFAVPHARHHSVDRIVGATALSSQGIEFDSLDHRPVNVIFLIVSPVGRDKEHFAMLERISRRVRSLPGHD